SVEISTPATTPPPVSAAVPVTVTRAPSARFAFGAGEVMVEDGAAVSVLAVAGARPGGSADGRACMSADRVALGRRMVTAGAVPNGFPLSRPQLHWTVPAPNTSSPLAAL